MLSKKPARTDLTSRECAKLICGLLGGLVPLLDEEDANVLRQVLGKPIEMKWSQSAPLRTSINAVAALIGALMTMTKDDPEELMTAIAWVTETDEVWKRLSNV